MKSTSTVMACLPFSCPNVTSNDTFSPALPKNRDEMALTTSKGHGTHKPAKKRFLIGSYRRAGYQVYDLNDKLLTEFKAERKTTTLDLTSIDTMTTKHFENLINAIRTGEKLRAPIDNGNISVTILQLSNIAWKLNRTLHLNKQDGHILDDPKAMEMWGREYEKGWELTI